ncbi:TIM-barrel domain-containing protein [Massilia sp. METH4]|uniref:TIM-barrel domain-containing protein n=1 Tax=Massilia sp. METH4 TaxID=3123041 RepID=UPI0030D18D23
MKITTTAAFALTFACPIFYCQGAIAQNAARHVESWSEKNGALHIITNDGRYEIRAYSPSIVETTFTPRGERHDARSHAVVLAPADMAATVKEAHGRIEYATSGIAVTIERRPLRIAYRYKGRPLVAEKLGYTKKNGMEALEFALDADEALYGAGARAVGMNRRGHRFQLYNKAHYGYGNRSELLNFTIPMALSSKKYAIHFDNPQTGWLDFDSRKDGTLTYETIGGRKTYQVVAGDAWADVMASYTSLTGRQPLPPRWAFGNFASRFGYRDEKEVRGVVDRFIADKIPLDAVVLDLYWFGKEVKGTMGNLAWDKDGFPNPQGMLRDLQRKGVNTVVITEPFVLTTSQRWQEAVDAKALATTKEGAPYTYDFFFGNTGLVDIFSPQGKSWFWNIYKGLKEQGVAGWWGDLGEPELHPAALQHATGSADQVHNIYGHDWARLIAEGYAKDFPNERPFILMRAGYSGSQRFGLIPWSGDVSRSWGGLQSQMEIALQMGMQGLAYMHSDLGGFAGPVLDDELYVRWLQYGVFQPVFRPHAQEEVPSEPVFRAPRAKALAADAIRLRYALLPYHYTMAFENSTTGMPLMRPVLFEDTENDAGSLASTYLWGGSFLVAPVTEPGAKRKEVYFPTKGSTWFDFHTGERHRGGIQETVDVVAERIPVYVRAGAFVPMAPVVQSTRDYTGRSIDLHYWHDAVVTSSAGMLYDDDGATADAYGKGKYEIARFTANARDSALDIGITTETGSAFQPVVRAYTVHVHGLAKPKRVLLDGRELVFSWDAKTRIAKATLPARARLQATLRIE